jgi:hypothetical protein
VAAYESWHQRNGNEKKKKYQRGAASENKKNISDGSSEITAKSISSAAASRMARGNARKCGQRRHRRR